MLVLYYAPNTASLACHVALEHAGAKYRLERVDFARPAQRWVDDPAAIEAMKRKVPESVGAAFALIEEELLTGPWVLGDAYSVCDAYPFTLAQWLEADGVDLGRLPRVLEHRQRMARDPVVVRCLAAELAA